MKKLTAFLFSLALIFGVAGVAGAAFLTHNETLELGVTIGEGPFARFFWGDSFSYSHSTPEGFSVPPATVHLATVSIYGYHIDSQNNQVSVGGSAVGDLTTGGWSFAWWDFPSVSTFDVAASFGSWDAGSLLGVTINTSGGFGDGTLYLSRSIFTLNYTNDVAPVPEPYMVLLMGAGFLGLVAYGRKKVRGK